MVISGNTSSMITVAFMSSGDTSIWLTFSELPGPPGAICMLWRSKNASSA